MLQNRINNPNLPSCIRNIRAQIAPHQRGPKADGQVPAIHAVHIRIRLDTVQMQNHDAESRIIWIRQLVNKFVQGVAAGDVIIDAGGADELVVESIGKEGVGELAEELLQDAGDAVNVEEEVFLFAKVNGGGVCISSVSKSD